MTKQSTHRVSRADLAPFDQTLEELIERFGISYSLGGIQYLRMPLETLIPSQILPFEIHVTAESLKHLPPRFIESKITNDAEWKQREIPILMELSRLLGHPSTTATETKRTRLWEFDDHQIVYSTFPAEGRHTLRIELKDFIFERFKEKAVEQAVRVDSLSLTAAGLKFEYQSFHRWLEETLQAAPSHVVEVTATKNASTLELASPKGVLTIGRASQPSLIIRDFGDRETILGFSLFITLKNPVGIFPQFVEASFCTCDVAHESALEEMGQRLAQFWGIHLRREISVARY